MILVTFETDVTGYGRKMGRNGGGNGYSMEDPHAYTSVELNQTLLNDYDIEMFNYGTYTPGNAIRYRTLNPGGSETEGGDIQPRKTGLGLPWDL